MLESAPAEPAPHRISTWQDAEINAARWLRYWGYRDAVAKPGGPDKGIDVRATGAAGQVKYQAAQVGRPALQRLVGAAPFNSGVRLFFFTGAGYSRDAVTYAQERGIALFVYELDGRMQAVNSWARAVVASRPLDGAGSPDRRRTSSSGAFIDSVWGERLLIACACLLPGGIAVVLLIIGTEKVSALAEQVGTLLYTGAIWLFVAAIFGAFFYGATRRR